MGGLTSCQNRLLTKSVSAKLDGIYVANLSLFMFLSSDNAVQMLWLVLCTTTARENILLVLKMPFLFIVIFDQDGLTTEGDSGKCQRMTPQNVFIKK